jgi:hypothetical protein
MAESKVKDAPKAGANGSNPGKDASGNTPKAVDQATGVETVQQPPVEELPAKIFATCCWPTSGVTSCCNAAPPARTATTSFFSWMACR